MNERRARVLVVDDHLAMAETVADGLVDRGYDALALASSEEAARRLREEPFDALVTDLRMPGVDGMELLSIARDASPECQVIVMTAFSAVDTAVESIRRGAYHYLCKPFKVEELALFLDRALDAAALRREATALERTLKDRYAIDNVVAESAAMQEVCELVLRVADADAPVLLTGETGTGKGLLARALHANGARAKAPFITVNCAALPEALLESEIFGHVKGAFTGASAARKGLFAEASGGTLFLDEIGEMSFALQAKLLDVLERGVVRAVGSNREEKVDVRVVAATHRELRERVAAGAFRQDLLYRLEVVAIEIPPLRLRRDDIPALLERFLAAARARHPQSPAARFGPEAMARLVDHAWPGNVRELEHVVERLVLLGKSAEIAAADLPKSIVPAKEIATTFGADIVPMRELQRRYAAWAYERLGGKKLVTAEKLGVDAKTLSRWLSIGEGEKKE